MPSAEPTATADLPTVEAYDPAADSWTSLPALPQPRSDLGVAIADARLVAVGGLSAGQALKTVSVMDLATTTWAGLPDMSAARHGMAVAAVGKIGVCDRRGDRCRRHPGDLDGGGAEAGTTQAPTRI